MFFWIGVVIYLSIYLSIYRSICPSIYLPLGGFRTPIGAPKAFNRSFKQKYSTDVNVRRDIKGLIVQATDGTKSDVKRVLPVHAASGYAEAGFALGNRRIQD